MKLQHRKHLTAWLGLIAMWLIVFAPVVSQLLVSGVAHERHISVPQHMSADCPMYQHAGAGHDAMADPLSACGYCDLLGAHPAMPSIPPMVLSLLVLAVVAAAPILSTRFTPLGAFPSGRPRAPPAIS
ncbi:DUF2946 domain-containing protein [Paraburkholderia denitrificans]|uniref:DUF2946 domain-containing protein n=1 Tax=Paraburkholderia denitrificans TaxID=694025 RepID=A0ABW0JCI7_9BURK